jgi:hypothetical protein
MKQNINAIILLFLTYILILKYKKNKSNNNKCIFENMTDKSYNNFIDKQFDNLNIDPLNKLKCSPECCPSLFSCDNGCICMSNETNNLISNRGNNRDCKYSKYI